MFSLRRISHKSSCWKVTWVKHTCGMSWFQDRLNVSLFDLYQNSSRLDLSLLYMNWISVGASARIRKIVRVGSLVLFLLSIILGIQPDLCWWSMRNWTHFWLSSYGNPVLKWRRNTNFLKKRIKLWKYNRVFWNIKIRQWWCYRSDVQKRLEQTSIYPLWPQGLSIKEKEREKLLSSLFESSSF